MNNIYNTLCENIYDKSIVSKLSKTYPVSRVIKCVKRIMLENSFTYTAEHMYQLNYSTMDKPLFFCIGVKTYKFKYDDILSMSNYTEQDIETFDDTQFIKYCQYIMLKPYHVYNTVIHNDKRLSFKNNQYLLTLWLISYFICKYKFKRIPKLLIKSYTVVEVSFDNLSQTTLNTFIHNICIQGVTFIKNIFTHHNLHVCGELLFTIISTDNVLHLYNIQNLNNNTVMSSKNGLSNYVPCDDVYNDVLPDTKYDIINYTKSWNFEKVVINKYEQQFHNVLSRTNILSHMDYLKHLRDSSDTIVSIPSLNNCIKQYIDNNALNEALAYAHATSFKTIHDIDTYYYISTPIKFTCGCVMSYIIPYLIKQELTIECLEPFLGMCCNKLSIYYKFPDTVASMQIVDESDIIVFQRTSDDLVLRLLLIYSIVYVLGWTPAQFKPYRYHDSIYCDGIYFKTSYKQIKYSIIVNDKLIYEQLLKNTYMKQLKTYYKQWIQILSTSTQLPPNVILICIDRINMLTKISTWI